MAAKFAVSLMALLGAVSAQSTGYTNSSSIATSTTSSASSTFSNNAMVTAANVVYLIQDDTTYSDATVLTLSRKRQANSGIGSCLNTCSDNSQCVGASYSDDTMTCQYYSEINKDSETSSPGTDFALVESRPGASSSANSTTSATGTHSATRPGVSGSSNSTSSATSSRPAGITGGAGNSTSSRPTGSVSRTSSSTGSSTPVPSSPSTIITINGVVFLLEINISYSGITIDFAILAKRAGQSLDDCLTTCSANSNCAGTSYEESTGTCTFYTSIDSDSRTPTNGVDFATVLSRANANNGAGTNGTSGAGNTTSPATNATAESFICPALDGSVLLSNLEVTFTVSCGQFLIGTTYDALSEINSKRQAVDNGLPSTLSNCVDLCSLAESCVGTTFEDATQTCTFYSAVSYATPLEGFDSATRVQDNSGNGAGEVVTATVTVGGQTITTTTTIAGATTTQYVAAPSTATVFVTSVSTVTSYVGGATGLPSGATVTAIVPVSTITYNPTVSTITLPQNYAAPTVTVTVGGSGSGSGAVTTVTVDQNGNVIGESTANAAAGGVGSYPTVTIYAACTTPAAQPVETTWTTVYVR